MSPFDLLDHSFMRRSLVACFALALSFGPLGVFLLLRRMSLMADALSHGILPGTALAFLMFGLSYAALGTGGLLAGIALALGSIAVSRLTPLREDASFALFYLTALSAGVILLSWKGGAANLTHFLFGNILSMETTSFTLLCGVSSVTVLSLAVLWRVWVQECFDPDSVAGGGLFGSLTHGIFLLLVVANLVASFRALGTLLSVGLLMLPAVASKFWARHLLSMCLVAMAVVFLAGAFGLFLSASLNLPSGPAMVLGAGVLALISVVVGPQGGLIWRLIHRRHFKA